MLVYRPLRPGLLRAEFITVYKPDGGSTLIGKDFEIDNDLHIKPYTGEIGSYYPGDCNGDDELTIGDAVVLNNYLSGNGELKNWQAADLNGDSAVNALDLTIQKRRIIENSSTKPRLKSYVSVNLIEIAHRSIQTAGSELCFRATVAYADCIGVSPKQVSSLFLYDAETDQQLAAFTQDEEDGGYYVCSIPAKDMFDKKFYAAAKFYNAADGKPEDAELIKSATVSLKGDKDAPPVAGKDNEKVVTLKTEFSEYGIGTTSVNFIAELSKELFPYVDSVTLYDENDEKVVQMTPDANKNLYDCTVTVNTDAPCTKQFSAVVEYKPDAAMSVGAITKICIDVPFKENPAPVEGTGDHYPFPMLQNAELTASVSFLNPKQKQQVSFRLVTDEAQFDSIKKVTLYTDSMTPVCEMTPSKDTHSFSADMEIGADEECVLVYLAVAEMKQETASGEPERYMTNDTRIAVASPIPVKNA